MEPVQLYEHTGEHSSDSKLDIDIRVDGAAKRDRMKRIVVAESPEEKAKSSGPGEKASSPRLASILGLGASGTRHNCATRDRRAAAHTSSYGESSLTRPWLLRM